MNNSVSPVVFFDIGQTLGAVRLSADFRLEGLDVYPYVPEVLNAFRDNNVRLGIISNTGNERFATIERVLQEAGLHQLFHEPDLLLYSSEVGLDKSSSQIFTLALERAGLTNDRSRCMYVGEDSTERYFAQTAGMLVCPHPLLASEALAGAALHYVRLKSPQRAGRGWRTELRRMPIVPLAVTGRDATTLTAIVPTGVAARLDDLGFEVDRLGAPNLALTTDLYLLRDDKQARTGFMNPAGQSVQHFGSGDPSNWILASSNEGIVVAVPALRSVEEVHFEDAGHGHNSKFLPDVNLLTPFGVGESYREANWLAAPSTWHGEDAELPLTTDVVSAIDKITPDVVGTYIDRYTGRKPLLGGQKIVSRHIHSADNLAAVQSLLREFESLAGEGLTARAVQFTHEGKVYYNVEAELRGRVDASGVDAEVVIVSAHLDSTAAFSDHAYNPRTDPAPGCDDDASGVAAVLAIANAVCRLPHSSHPLRTMRFVLFNAEEHGLVGSRAYARDQAACGAPIVAVFQMDMIGFAGTNITLPRPYEIHAGFPDDPDVQQRSHVLAKRIRKLAPLVTRRQSGAEGLAVEAQIYLNPDPASGRSDHASFQERGYAACAVSEDFFLGPDPHSPAPQANPHYHKDTDVEVTADYVSDIARAVGAAALVTANSPGRSRTSAQLRTHAMSSKIDVRQQAYERLTKQSGYRDQMNFRLNQLQQSGKDLSASVAGGSTVEVVAVNPLTMSPKTLTVAKSFGPVAQGSRIADALQLVSQLANAPGFGAGSAGPQSQFVPDTRTPTTSGGTTTVNLQQHYAGIPVFQMTRTVRFAKEQTDIVGDHVQIASTDYVVQPKLSAIAACSFAARKVAAVHASATPDQKWGESKVRPVDLEIESYTPAIEVSFGLPAQPTVLSAGKFAHQVPAHLVIFYVGPDDAGRQVLRLSWQLVFTLPDAQGQYRAVVSADTDSAEILYLNEISRTASATKEQFANASRVAASVYKTSPRQPRANVTFPLPRTEYPNGQANIQLPATFPFKWTSGNSCQGPSTLAVRGYTSDTYRGTAGADGTLTFNPGDAVGNDQKVLNIFYYCCYMHDFFYMLGFNESAGNFSGDDPVVARAHPGPVWGTANMATYPDGQRPEMNMGLVSSTNNHTAFDADVVFHEFVHGVTNRLVGGPMNTSALEEPQSGGMGEGYGDYFALTIQNFGQPTERFVTGDWVTGNPKGIRNYPYDDRYPLNFGQLGQYVGGIDLTEVHNIGEIWCACLMHINRRLGDALGATAEARKRGVLLGWQIVVDSLKLMPVNPSFLDARDSMLKAAKDLRGTLTPAEFTSCWSAMWAAFAGFGMGINASSIGATLHGVHGDNTIPNDPDVATSLRGTTVNRPTSQPAILAFENSAPPDFQKIAQAWPNLSEATRGRILGIAEEALSSR